MSIGEVVIINVTNDCELNVLALSKTQVKCKGTVNVHLVIKSEDYQASQLVELLKELHCLVVEGREVCLNTMWVKLK